MIAMLLWLIVVLLFVLLKYWLHNPEGARDMLLLIALYIVMANREDIINIWSRTKQRDGDG